ncbi:Uma2 family endonuclease [Streptomyces sp. WMMC940]|uniref:Uma2 family endonuclease n=1 Tax=Streptomyces sp. WMMC940 TaxID=3015153 RepID=UPI0022B6BC1E|nr:Uma2 family endonuclease [Streptomyces sp. WMMC940]MCZ7460382.1 Uma2 family endonuclease [Streptomyces sp. WMMC940]
MTLMLERPTTIEAARGTPQFEALCDTLLSMEVPDGYRAEIVRGNIVMSPWSRGFYLPVMESVLDQLKPERPQGHIMSSTPFLFAFPGEERAYGPDIYAAAPSAFRTDSRYVDGEALSFVCELTSSATRLVDWQDKVPVYGRAGVPVYLLLDMQEQTATVFWEPSAKGYLARRTAPFGEKPEIPDPFGCELDTGVFEVPADATEG